MDENDIYVMFLKIISDYQHLEWTEEELKEEFDELLDMALTEVQLLGIGDGVYYDKDLGFNCLLNRPFAYILAHGVALQWVTPKVQSAEMLAYALTSTDFTLFSPSNRLQSCIKLKNEMQAKLNNLVADYDTRLTLHLINDEIKEKEKGGAK